MTFSCASSHGQWWRTSSGLGSRLPGGRALTTFVMKTSSRRRPASARTWSRSLPAAPTNGRPVSSSLRPGASPTRTTPARALPSPGTRCVHVAHGSESHGRWSSISRAMAARSAAGSSATDEFEAPAAGSRSICAVAMTRASIMYWPMTSSSSTSSCASKRSDAAANVSSSGLASRTTCSVKRDDERVVAVEPLPRARAVDLGIGRADVAGDLLVLDPLVLGAGRERGDAQDRQLAQDRVDLRRAEQRAAEGEPRAERRLGVGEQAEDVQRREHLERLADALGRAGRIDVRDARHAPELGTSA